MFCKPTWPNDSVSKSAWFEIMTYCLISTYHHYILWGMRQFGQGYVLPKYKSTDWTNRDLHGCIHRRIYVIIWCHISFIRIAIYHRHKSYVLLKNEWVFIPLTLYSHGGNTNASITKYVDFSLFNGLKQQHPHSSFRYGTVGSPYHYSRSALMLDIISLWTFSS